MKRSLIALPAILLAAAAFAVDPEGKPAEAKPAAPFTFTGTLRDDPLDSETSRPQNGLLFIRSQERLTQVTKQFTFKPNTTLPKFDFSHQSLVLIYAANRRPADQISLLKSDLHLAPMTADVLLTYNDGPEEKSEQRTTKFLGVLIDYKKIDGLELPYENFNPAFKLTLFAEWLRADSRRDTLFTATLGGKGGTGDIVDNLTAKITPKAATIKVGEDILVDLQLQLADLGNAKQFGATPKLISVWDGKYSNGYRNHGFLVTDPKGKTVFLQPAKVSFDKNAPHPVTITADKPYHLPNWVEGDTYKSLKDHGLDTTVPGMYTIEGVYTETATGNGVPPLDPGTRIWAGSIASNRIHIQVKDK